MLKAVLFDLDGTLLPMNEESFIPKYLNLLANRMEPRGYNKEDFIKVLWSGTKKMYLNDGSKSNEQVFWDEFTSFFGKDCLKDKAYVDEFYTNEFLQTKSECKENSLAKKIVKFVKDNNLLCILSTNPIFPSVGTITRMSYIDLLESDFDFVTFYENFNFTKPNPMYFKKLLEKYSLKPEEVILIGNNELEDAWCANQVGIKAYLVKDYLITSDKLIEKAEIISMEEVIPVIKKEMELRR